MYLYIFEDGNIRTSVTRPPTEDDLKSVEHGLLNVLIISTSNGWEGEIITEVEIYNPDGSLESIEDLRIGPL